MHAYTITCTRAAQVQSSETLHCSHHVGRRPWHLHSRCAPCGRRARRHIHIPHNLLSRCPRQSAAARERVAASPSTHQAHDRSLMIERTWYRHKSRATTSALLRLPHRSLVPSSRRGCVTPCNARTHARCKQHPHHLPVKPPRRDGREIQISSTPRGRGRRHHTLLRSRARSQHGLACRCQHAAA